MKNKQNIFQNNFRLSDTQLRPTTSDANTCLVKSYGGSVCWMLRSSATGGRKLHFLASLLLRESDIVPYDTSPIHYGSPLLAVACTCPFGGPRFPEVDLNCFNCKSLRKNGDGKQFQLLAATPPQSGCLIIKCANSENFQITLPNDRLFFFKFQNHKSWIER